MPATSSAGRFTTRCRPGNLLFCIQAVRKFRQFLVQRLTPFIPQTVLPRAARLAGRLLMFVLMTMPVGARLVSAAEDAGPYPAAPAAVITPGHVLARLNLAADYAEDVRWLMGRNTNHIRTLHVREAQPREVYFQARSLFEKANRLTAEYLDDRVTIPPTPPADRLRPADVYGLMSGTLQRLLLLRSALGMDELDHEESLPVAGATPTDVYIRTLEVSRQINELAERPLNARDSMQAVLRASALTRGILQQCGIEAPIEAAAEIQPGHVPADVFHRILQNVRVVSGIMVRQGQKMLFVAPTRATSISESDVIDVTNLLISELAFIGRRMGLETDDAGAIPAESPAIVTPSSVMSQVDILETRLARLAQCLAASPGRLGGPAS